MEPNNESEEDENEYYDQSHWKKEERLFHKDKYK